MYYGTKTEEEFTDIVKKANLKDPNLDIKIHLQTEIFQIVKKIYELNSNKGQIIAYYIPFERVLIVESPEISLQYKVKQVDNWDVWDESWKGFKVYIPIEFLTKNKENYIGAYAWLVNLDLVDTRDLVNYNCIAKERVYITTFENNGAGCVHTVQYC